MHIRIRNDTGLHIDNLLMGKGGHIFEWGPRSFGSIDRGDTTRYKSFEADHPKYDRVQIMAGGRNHLHNVCSRTATGVLHLRLRAHPGEPLPHPHPRPVAEGVRAPHSTTWPPRRGEWSEYRDGVGLKLEHPKEWAAKPGGTRVDGWRRNVSIVRQTLPASMTLEAYTDLTLGQFRALQELRRVPGPAPDHRRLTRLQPLVPGRPRGVAGDLTFLSVWTVKGRRAWVFTYTASPEFFGASLGEFDRMLASVTLPG